MSTRTSLDGADGGVFDGSGEVDGSGLFDGDDGEADGGGGVGGGVGADDSAMQSRPLLVGT